MSQAELQQDVQRAATTFMDRTAQASEGIGYDGDTPDDEMALLRRVLLYNSSVLDIATGPFPEVNALDMKVFAALCRGVLERHWIPRHFGDHGKPLLEAFTLLDRTASEVTEKFLDAEQQLELDQLVAGWQAEHPDQYRVEGVRFQEFAEHAGAIENARNQKARGLLGQVRSATQAADQALVISERAFFVAHRMPFLIRMQSRLGIQETLSDSLGRVDDLERVLEKLPGFRPLLGDLMTVTDTSRACLCETRALAELVEPHLHRLTAGDGATRGAGLEHTLASLNALTERSLSLVRELRGALGADPARSIAAVEQRADRAVRRFVLYALGAALVWTAFFWVAFYVVTRA